VKTTAITPKALAEKRADMVKWYENSRFYGRNHEFTRSLHSSELFYVTKEVAQLARVASHSLDTWTLTNEDLVSPNAFFFFEDHKFTGAGNVVYYRTVREMPSYLPIDTYVSRDLLPAATKMVRREGSGHEALLDSLLEDYGKLDSRPFVHFAIHGMPVFTGGKVSGVGIPQGSNASWFWDSDSHRTKRFEKRMMALFRLIQQGNIMDEARTKAPRHLVDRAKKLGQPKPKAVRVISLRRREGSGRSNGATDRTYFHQWYVRGHWRNQWYPSRGVHRPVWISPHLKGPDDAPVLTGTKVYKI